MIDLTGIRVTLDAKLCCSCNAIVARDEDGEHGLCCAECNSRSPLDHNVVRFLQDTVRVFGTPPTPIFINSAINRKATKVNRNDLFPSKYFKAADLGGKSLVLAIKSCRVEKMQNTQGGTSDKLVLDFVNQSKGLVCNRTNYDAISEVHGDDSDGWPGKRVELYPDKTRVAGKTVDTVRVRPPLAEDLNDAIPI